MPVRISPVGIALMLLVPCLPAAAGQVVTGNIYVCRKPMMQGMVAAIRLMTAPPNIAAAERERRKLAEVQRDQAESCFYVSKVELTDNGGDKADIGWGQWCQEFTGKANGEEVFVPFGSAKRQFGSCP
jgi:hypothetical protein